MSAWSLAGIRPTGLAAKIELHSGFLPIVTGKLTKCPFRQGCRHCFFIVRFGYNILIVNGLRVKNTHIHGEQKNVKYLYAILHNKRNRG